MGMNATTMICYGVDFEEDFEFPWSERDDIEDWWIYDILRFQHTKLIFTDDGDYLEPKATEKEIDFYFEERSDFLKNNPLPVDLIHHGHCDYSKTIIAIGSTVKSVDYGEVVKIDLNHFNLDKEEYDKFIHFLAKYIEFNGKDPKWLLSAYWG